MKKLSKYFCLSALALGLWSCSKDEIAIDDTIQQFEGEQAVVNIRICAPTDGTRSNGQSSDYSNGSDDENYVRKLNFYFYDKTGDYVTCYEGATYEPVSGTSEDYVEEIGKSKIVLTDLLGKNYPAYVVAVINYGIDDVTTGSQTDLRFKRHLLQVQTTVRDYSASTQNYGNPWVKRDSKITDFVMTSATHSNNQASADFGYFATALTAENFAVQPNDTKPGQDWTVDATAAKAVNIYVERLAAKVELLFPGYTLVNGTNDESYYETTIKDPKDKTKDREFDIDGEENVKLKVRLYGWDINGQPKSMKYFKAVNDNANPFLTTDGWSFDGTNRCYWAKTPGYGEGKYPSSFEDVDKKTGNTYTDDDDDAVDDNNNYTLRYISWNTVKGNNFNNKVVYVVPHTEVGEQINLAGNAICHSAIPEVLIAAQIVKEDGTGMDLFEIGGTLYTKNEMLKYLLNAAGAHIWKYDGKKPSEEDPNKEVDVYKNIEPNDVEVYYDYDGAFRVRLRTTGDNLYTGDWFQDSEGTLKYKDKEAVADEINAYLPKNQTWCYKEGMMYYNIPIRHLRDLTTYKVGDEIKTGHYGVVRNHWYQVTVGSVTNLGHAVYRPDEHIIPPSDDTRYMIGSSVKILNWRLVKQTAEL